MTDQVGKMKELEAENTLRCKVSYLKLDKRIFAEALRGNSKSRASSPRSSRS